MSKDLMEEVIKKIRKRIENPKFKSKVEVARLALREYDRELDNSYKKRLQKMGRRVFRSI